MKYSDEVERIKRLYTEHYPVSSKDISYIWHPRNPVSIHYRHAQEKALVSLLNDIKLDIGGLRILDVGCGLGSLLRFMASLGGDPRLMHGVDLIPDRLRAARQLAPDTINLSVCNAQHLPYPNKSFDLACLFTVLSSILEQDMRLSIAQEINRVIKTNGFLLWYDMCYSKSTNTNPISVSTVKSLFSDFECDYHKQIHTAWGRRFAKHSYLIGDIVDQLPLLRKTHNLLLLKKTPG